MNNIPYLFEINQIGDNEIGFISILENSTNNLFSIKRVYWTYDVPADIIRGNHAHYKLEQVIVAISGILELTLENINGESFEFLLDNPNKALYIPPKHWRTIQFSDKSVLLCLASRKYDEKDYIREYNKFLTLRT